MKNRIIICLFFLAALLSACGKASLQQYSEKELDGVQLVITKTEEGSISYKLSCDETVDTLTTGNSQDAVIEKWVNNEWRQLEAKEGFAWTMEAYEIKAPNCFEGSLAVSEKYGELAPGRYRLLKAFTAPGGSFSAKAEFEQK